MLNIFKLGKYVVAWSLPLAQTSNTKTHLHKRSRQTIQEHLKKQPANVLMYKNLPLFYVRFQTIVDRREFLIQESVYSTYEFFFMCVKSYSLYAQEWSAFTYVICSLMTKFPEIVFSHIEVIMNEKGITHEHWRNFSCSYRTT